MPLFTSAEIEQFLLPQRMARRLILTSLLEYIVSSECLTNPFLLLSRLFVRLKSADSILEKIQRKGLIVRSVPEIGQVMDDLLGFRIITENLEELWAIDQFLMETFEVMVERTDAFKAKHGADAIHDVQYVDTVRDPLGTVRKIYERFDEPLTAEAEAAMHAYMADNQKGKHGKHSYDLAEYGLTREAVHERFKDYIERYDIPVKG